MEVIDKHKVGYKKTKLGLIPNDWDVVSLGKIGKIISGLTYSPNDINENGILVLRSSNVQNRQLEFNDNVYVNVDEGDFNPVIENDILICVRNGSRSLIGKNALINKESEGYAFGAFMTVYRSKLNKFLFHLFDTDLYNKEVNKNLGATINSINGSDLKKFLMPLPPIEERDEITSILSDWDNAIEKTQTLIEKLLLRKKGLMQKILKGKIRIAIATKEPLPNWETKKLSFYLEHSNKKNFDMKFKKNDVLSVSGQFGIVNQIELQGRSFAGASVANYGVVENGDVVYTKSPLKSNPFGIIKVNKGRSGIVSTLYAIYKCKENISGEFLDYYFQLDDNVNSYLRPLVQKGTKNDMKINNEKVLSDNVFFPSKAEQDIIVEFFKSIDLEIENYKNYLERIKSQKQGLMQQLLTGKIRVKVN